MDRENEPTSFHFTPFTNSASAEMTVVKEETLQLPTTNVAKTKRLRGDLRMSYFTKKLGGIWTAQPGHAMEAETLTKWDMNLGKHLNLKGRVGYGPSVENCLMVGIDMMG